MLSMLVLLHWKWSEWLMNTYCLLRSLFLRFVQVSDNNYIMCLQGIHVHLCLIFLVTDFVKNQCNDELLPRSYLSLFSMVSNIINNILF